MARSISPKPARNKGVRKPRPGLLELTRQQEEGARTPAIRKPPPLTALSERQSDYINAILSNILTFGLGPAGTGKTYIAASLAAEAFMKGDVDKIILTRPAVEAGEELGFMPGDLSEKYAHYLTPLIEVLNERLGRGPVEMFMKNGRIEALPLAFMRGRTFKKAFVILDEAQNTTSVQMKMFLTRIGEDSRIVIDGDITQRDIPGPSGLVDAMRRVSFLDGVTSVTFTKADVVRSGLVQDIIEAYENHDEDDEE